MKRCLHKVIFLIVICCLMIGLTQTAMANAGTFRTTDGVRLRSAGSLEANIIRVINAGTNVEVLEHDPAGWSRVRHSGTTGFIRSDFLRFPGLPATFRTTDGVNLRAGPSTTERILRTVVTGTNVEVLEHDPAGWSRVRINNTNGFIRSDFLARPPSQAASSTSQPQTPLFLKTADGVNFRTGPSTTSTIIRTLRGGTNVEVLEQGSNGWSMVKVNETVGYIKSDLLSIGGGKIELLDWSVARNIVPTGVNLRVVDVRTGITFNLRAFSKGGHADVETPTREDTDAILRSRNGVWAWAPRPVWVTIGDRTIAAALNGMPHDVSTISGNGMNGHLCLHFNNTVTNSKSYQRDLNNAVMEAWNAGR